MHQTTCQELARCRSKNDLIQSHPNSPPLGIIERTNSKFNSAIFTVRKKEGQGLRVVLDYRFVSIYTTLYV